MKFGKAITSFSLLAIIGFSLFVTKDLKQINNEDIFMGKNAQAKNIEFNEKVGDKPILVVGIKNSQDNWVELKLELEKLESQHHLHLFDGSQLKKQIDLFPFYNEIDRFFILSFPKKINANEQKHIFEKLDKIFPSNEFDTKYAGSPYVNNLLNQYSEQIQTKLFPFMFFVSFILILLVTTSLTSSLIIFLPSLASATLSLLGIQLIYSHMDMITSIVPLLTFVLNLSLGLHLYYTHKETGNIKETLKEKIEPIILMVITTAIGFGSLAFSEIQVIGRFGLLSFILIIITSFVHVMSAKHLYQDVIIKGSKLALLREFFIRISNKELPKAPSFLLLGILLILGLASFPQIKTLTEAEDFFPQSEGVRESMQYISEHFIGNPNFEILINKKELPDLEFLKKLDLLEKKIELDLTESKIVSPTVFVKQINQAYSEIKALPGHQLALPPLLSQIPQQIKDQYMREDFYRLTVFGPLLNDERFVSDQKKILSIFKEAGINVSLGGLYFNLRSSHQDLMKILGKSFLISLAFILLLSVFHFRNMKYLIIFSVVNLFPAIGTFCVMALLGLTFNIATIMTFSIALGMVVDGTFHLGHDFKNRRDKLETVRKTKVPILIGGIILLTSFLMFSTNSFLPIRQFGICLTINIAWGLVCDLLVLPTLLKAFIKGDDQTISREL